MATYTEYQQRLLDQAFERELDNRVRAQEYMKSWIEGWRKQQLPEQLEFEFMKEAKRSEK